MSHFAFTVRWDRADSDLIDAARRKGAPGTTLDEIEQGGLRPLLLEEIIRPEVKENELPAHFGKTTTLLWRWAYQTFVGGHSLVALPPRFQAKSVLLADVYEK